MFGKKKPELSPVTDAHRQLVATMQERFSAIGQMQNPVQKILALDSFSKDIAQTAEKLSGDFQVFFEKKKKSRAIKMVSGAAAACVGAVTLTAIVASGGAALGVGLVATVLGGPPILSEASNIRYHSRIKRTAFEATCPELASLTKLDGEAETLRQNMFEAPECVNALAQSIEFPTLLEIARPDEKKVLTFAFRAAAENNKEAPAQVVRLPGKDSKFKPL